DVGDRLARGASRDQGAIRIRERRGRLVAAVGDERGAIPAEDMTGEQLRVERGFVRRDAGRGQDLTPARDGLANRGHQADASAAVASLSFSDVKCVTAASISSSRSPSSATGSWCIVK